MKSPARFTVLEVRRAVVAAQQSGPDWVVEITSDGAIRIVRVAEQMQPVTQKLQPEPASIGDDDLIPLTTALACTTLRGVMNLSQLNRRASSGRLVSYKIAGKTFTTLNHIADMRRMFSDPAPRTVAQKLGALRAIAAMHAHNAREDEKRRAGRRMRPACPGPAQAASLTRAK